MNNPSRWTGAATPWGFLGMVALVVAIEVFAVRSNLDFADNVAASWKFTGRHLRLARGKTFLCFGDSMVKFGLLSPVLSSEANAPVYNLALQSGSAPSSYFLFRRALESGARPRAVVVDFARGILGDGPASVTRPYPWADLLNLRETLDLCWQARDAGLFASIIVRDVLHSDKGRYEIRDNILTALRGSRTGQGDITMALWRNWKVNGGGQANPKVAEFPDAVIPDNVPHNRGTWVCDPVNAAYVRRFIDLAARHHVTVYWLLTPVTPGTLSQWVHSGDEERWVEFVRSEQARATNAVVIDGRRAGFARAVFVDGVHLDVDGAVALSACVAKVLAHHAGAEHGPRWLDLPRFTRPPALIAEDVGRSRIELKASLMKRRR